MQNSYSLFVQAQITWGSDPEHSWSKVLDPRSFLNRKSNVPTEVGAIQLLGQQRKRTADDWLFQQLQTHWGVLNTPYDQFRVRYNRYANQRTEAKQPVVPFHKWKSRNPESINYDEQEKKKHEEEKLWQTMDRQVWEVVWLLFVLVLLLFVFVLLLFVFVLLVFCLCFACVYVCFAFFCMCVCTTKTGIYAKVLVT